MRDVKQTLLAIAVLGGLGACAHTPAPSPPPASVSEAEVEAQLVAVIDAWVAAEIAGDRTALEALLDPDFLATWTSGKTIGRTAYIDAILAAKVAPFSVRHDIVRTHGDTAVHISVSGDTKFTSILLRKGGQWRVISETFTRMKQD